jgi:ferritin
MEDKSMLNPDVILKLKEQFKAETAAYTAYETIKKMVDHEYLEDA